MTASTDSPNAPSSEVSPAVARSQHSIWSAVRAAVTLWYALLGGIAAWTIHLLFAASFVRYTCNDPSANWAMHAVTAVTLAMTVLAMVLSWRLARRGRDESSDRNGGPTRFIGRLGLVVGASNFALIALEELYIVELASRRCG
jgi:membrane protein implicated in regulation of membrane protease activity